MSSSETISKYSIPQSIDLQTATSLFYIGLISLVANLTFIFSPLASLILVYVLLVQKRWKVDNHLLKLVILIVLLPLLLNLFASALQQVLIFSFSGIESIGSHVLIKPSNNSDGFYIISSILRFIILPVIAGISAILILLNIAFPIFNRFIRIIVFLPLLILMLATAPLSLLGGFLTSMDVVDYLNGKFINPAELIIDKNMGDYHVRAYRIDPGALDAFSVEVNQEKELPFHLKFVRGVSRYDHCDKVQIKVLTNQRILITPNIDAHEPNRPLASPKIFNLKPFITKAVN